MTRRSAPLSAFMRWLASGAAERLQMGRRRVQLFFKRFHFALIRAMLRVLKYSLIHTPACHFP